MWRVKGVVSESIKAEQFAFELNFSTSSGREPFSTNYPSITSLFTIQEWWEEMSGIVLNVAILEFVPWKVIIDAIRAKTCCLLSLHSGWANCYLVSEKEVWSGPYAVPTELVGEGARKTGGTYWTCTDNVTIKRNQFLLERMNHLSTVSYIYRVISIYQFPYWPSSSTTFEVRLLLCCPIHQLTIYL